MIVPSRKSDPVSYTPTIGNCSSPIRIDPPTSFAYFRASRSLITTFRVPRSRTSTLRPRRIDRE